MLLRIALAIAILAGVAVAVVNFVQVKEKVTTIMTARDTFETERNSARGERDTAKRDLATTKNNLDTTTKQLTATRTERDRAVTERDDQRKEATRLKDQLDKTTNEKNEAQRELAAWKALDLSVDQVKVVILDLKQATKDLGVLTNQVFDLTHRLEFANNRLAKLLNQNIQVAEPDVVAKVIEVDPRFGFAVLDVGMDKGMLPDGDMLLSRDGKLVATVRIHTVEQQRCIANILPGQLAEVFEGDLAVPKLLKP